MKVVIRVSSTSRTTEHMMTLFENFQIGRAPESTCQVNDDRVSSRHCRFYLKNDRLEIFDLSSKNGTYLNGIRVDHSEVFIGDVIKIGETEISLVEAHMENNVVEILTFPGPHKDRLTYELKADFTGARIQNQLFDKNQNHNSIAIQSTPAHRQEIAIRKILETDIVLSKEEIRNKYQTLSKVSNVLDFVIVIILCVIPYVYITNFQGEEFLGLNKELFTYWQTHILGAVELLVISTYFVMNKTNKFTLGEKLAGIEEKYRKQAKLN